MMDVGVVGHDYYSAAHSSMKIKYEKATLTVGARFIAP